MKSVFRTYNGQTVEEFQFSGELLSINSNPLTNVNGKEYHVCTVRFKDVDGNVQTSTAIMYGANYAYGVKEGNSYLCTATPTVDADGNESVIIKVSHLQQLPSAERPSLSMFRSKTPTVVAEASVIAGEDIF
jgi:hypothetical protein